MYKNIIITFISILTLTACGGGESGTPGTVSDTYRVTQFVSNHQITNTQDIDYTYYDASGMHTNNAYDESNDGIIDSESTTTYELNTQSQVIKITEINSSSNDVDTISYNADGYISSILFTETRNSTGLFI